MNAKQALQQATLYTDDTPYLMIGLHPRAITAAAGVLAEVGEPFSTLIVDKDEVTLIISSDAYQEFEKRLPDARLSEPMRLLTFDLVLPMELTGFMALVSNLLAEGEIPIIPLGAFERDHLLIAEAHFPKAMEILEKAKDA